jgi:hypothetical protein
MNTTFEPTIAQVEYEVRRTGFDHNYCREQLTSKATAEAQRLNAVAPDAAQEIEEAQRIADEAAAKANEVRGSRKATIALLEVKLKELGKHRATTEQFRAMGEGSLETVAASAMDAYFAALLSPCPQNNSAWESRLQWLSQLTSLRPHMPARLAALDAKADTMLAEIKAIAKRGKIDLGNLVQIMRHECGEIAGTELRDHELHRLFQAGFIDIGGKP